LSKTRILIVEDEELIAFTLSRLLEGHGYETEISGSVASAIDALEAAERVAQFEHVLLDLNLPDADGENVLHHVERMRSRPNVIVVAASQNMDGYRFVSLRGRCEYLPKPVIVEPLLALLRRRVHPGIEHYVEAFAFSPQEHAVVRYAVAGLDDEAICKTTECSRSTVKTYWSRIYGKLGVKGRDHVLAHFARWLLSERERTSGSYRAAL